MTARSIGCAGPGGLSGYSAAAGKHADIAGGIVSRLAATGKRPQAELLAVACALAAAWSAPALGAGARLVWYTSPVDGTRQAYGVYVPAGPSPPGGYPAVFHGHGYGWSVSAHFSPWQKQWADQHGWVLININARGPTFYEGIGQQAVYEVVKDAAERFGLDRRRLFFVGGSMGGTGAFREGVRHPELFAAVVAVDGWGDWRLWHRHWYARTDMRDDIEEFRRPLLSSVAPLYWLERAMWARIRSVTDGRDTIVWPDNSLRLIQRLAGLSRAQPGGFRHDIIVNYKGGHGAGGDLRRAYKFFLHAAPAGLGRRLRLKVWRLAYARQGWVAITRIWHFGEPAVVESVARGPVISLWTDNVQRLQVLPAECPDAAARGWCTVYVDGFAVYQGAPGLISVEAVRNADGAVMGWRPAGAEIMGKRPGLEGPIGDAFTQPFVVVYATGGSESHRAVHREEAEAFCQQWNRFFVHGPGITPLPEDKLDRGEMQHKNVVLFGCLDCSRLLRLADRQWRLPVRIRHSSVAVCEPGRRPRIYQGEQFGAFAIYPNPLAGMKRYVVVCRGRWYAGAEASRPRGLEYDLEKLPWAYPDYVVFNTDQRQLPLVVNVNNKPPVTCYEAAYFAEAGYFDNAWQPDGGVILRWTRALRPERARLIHVAEVKTTDGYVAVRVVDAGGKAVAGARVTVEAGGKCASSVTDPRGWAWFCGLPDRAPARVLWVMATGCAYDRDADCPAAHPLAADLSLAARYVGPAAVGRDSPLVKLAWQVANLSREPVEARLAASMSVGHVSPARRTLLLAPGENRRVEFGWQPHWPAAGKVFARLEICVRGSPPAVVQGRIEVAEASPQTVTLEANTEAVREGWRVTATVRNASSRPRQVKLAAFVVQAAMPLATRRLWLDPQGEATVVWTVPADAGRLWSGPADVVVTAGQGGAAVAARCQIILRSREAEHFAFSD